MAQVPEKSRSRLWYRFYMLYLGACNLLLYYTEHVKGQVKLSPSVVALVCEAGDQLELTCNSSSPLHTWKFTAISESGAAMTYETPIQSLGPTGLLNSQEQLTLNSTVIFTFSRLSTERDLPLISRVMIENVSEGLNGVEIQCTDAGMINSAPITIQIIGDVQTSELTIQSLSERFSSERVMVILEWTLSSSLTQYPQLLQNVNVSIVPDSGVEMLLLGNTRIQLTLLYNTLYNVSIVQLAACEQLSQAAFIELKYSKCSNPLTLVNASVIVEGYEDPALEGEIVMFSCSTGLMMTGPNSAMCLGNGEWEPDPREVNCIDNVIGTPTSVSDNETELPDPTTTAMLRAALISVVCLSILTSAVMVVVGVVCGHCISQRLRTSTASKLSKSSTVNEHGEDLELKENVAYVTVHPK